MKKIVIVGGGVAGLSCGHILAEAGFPVVILEKERDTGGLARTFTYGDFIFDIGPHRFFTTNDRVLRFITDTLDDDYLTIDRRSGVHFLSQYHLWPLRLKSVFLLPPLVAVQAFIDIFAKEFAAHPPGEEQSFEDYVLRKYGKTLYSTFFRDYTQKFIGIAGHETHADWAKIGVERATISKKITTGSLFLILRTMLLPLPEKTKFIYPRKGCQVFCDNLREKIRAKGGEVHLSAAPVKITREGGTVTSVTAAGSDFEVDTLFWSGRLDDLYGLLGLEGLSLSYLSLMLYNVELRKLPRYRFQWCYFGAKDIIFSRVTDPLLFSPDTAPRGKGGLCVEVTASEGNEVWRDPEKFKDRVISDLVKVKMIGSRDEVQAVHIEPIPAAYPVYRVDYQEHLAKAKETLAPFKNLTLFGRTGLFWYNNMDHSIENVFEVTDRFLGEKKP
ncbi:MAG: FAD-dependent oxidoreductase [Candidatus Eremiobacteraeota bacterium]|nr:FAD-dependent oxidoreductase [Candidatus Eremiobacteraeota bacterium]